MRILFIVLAVCANSANISALKCITCEGAHSFEECDATGRLEECRINQESCETSVRRIEDRLTITKGCKDAVACRNNRLQNYGRSGRSRQCNLDQINSVCTCCCDSNLCNSGTPSCVDFYRVSAAVNDCPALSITWPHGKIECPNRNKPGAACEYQCTDEDYSVWPREKNLNVCFGNGTWAHEEPCCARPCPPYFLFDDVLLIHFENPDGIDQLNVFFGGFAQTKIADDAIKMSALYFNDAPVESTVIKFNEYEADPDKLVELFYARISAVNKGAVNTGAAMRYALDNLLTAEAGMRGDQVKKIITVITDKNSDDDVKSVAEEARRRGITIYFLGVEINGHKFDREQLMQITGDEDRIFLFENTMNQISPKKIADMVEHFCSNPCDHVMHDH